MPRQILNKYALNKIRDIVEDFSKDKVISTTVKYRKFNEGHVDDFNPENQAISSTSIYTDYLTVSMVKSMFSDREVFLAGGSLEVGDVRFLVSKDLLSGIPRTRDILVEGGVSYNIKNIWTDPLDLSWVFHGREV